MENIQRETSLLRRENDLSNSGPPIRTWKPEEGARFQVLKGEEIVKRFYSHQRYPSE